MQSTQRSPCRAPSDAHAEHPAMPMQSTQRRPCRAPSDAHAEQPATPMQGTQQRPCRAPGSAHTVHPATPMQGTQRCPCRCAQCAFRRKQSVHCDPALEHMDMHRLCALMEAFRPLRVSA
eukprot:357422-Chlamydomonas_euryale.AAC.7